MNVTCNSNFSCSNTSEISEEDFSELLELLIPFLIFLLLYIFLASLFSLFTLIFCIVTWILIPKWRSFRNYVYFNVIFCYTMSIWISYGIFFMDLQSYELDTALFIIVFYFVNASSCWLFLGSFLIYMDIVVVFQRNITRKMLKANSFCWGVPLLLAALQITGELISELKIFVVLIKDSYAFAGLMLMANFILYIKVLCCLFNNSGLNVSPRVWQKVQVATFTFLLSGAPVLIASLMSMSIQIRNIYSVLNFLPMLLPTLQTIILNACFLLMKSNRVSWRQRRILTARSACRFCL